MINQPQLFKFMSIFPLNSHTRMMCSKILLLYFICWVHTVRSYISTSKCRRYPIWTKLNAVNTVTVSSAYNEDIPRVANFLGQFWYSMDLTKSQRSEFIRLEKNDLITRYGEQVGQRKYPAVLLMAKEDEEILG